MPLELWVQAALHQLRIREVPVPCIYLDEKRSFGRSLDDPFRRLRHYQDVLQRSVDTAGLRLEDGWTFEKPHSAKSFDASQECA